MRGTGGNNKTDLFFFRNIATGEISNAAARDALHCYVQNKFCYGKKAANQMTIRDMMHSYVFQVGCLDV